MTASIVTTLAGTMSIVVLFTSAPAAGQLASVVDGRYHHVTSNVEFPVPVGWSVLKTAPSSGGGEQMYLRDEASPMTYVAVWMKSDPNTAAEADAWLALAVKMKFDQRGGSAAGYAFRPASIRHLFIGNHKAVQAVADFAHQGVEYFTWIYTKRTRVQFDVRGAEPDASATASRLEAIIHAANIP